jgi:hypothetical protein
MHALEAIRPSATVPLSATVIAFAATIETTNFPSAL